MPSPTILVVDDNRLSRWSIGTILERAGYRVHEAATGKEGLAAVKQNTPDLVLLDVMLPDVDGFTVLKAIREAHRTLPVLMMTSAPTAELAHRASTLGARASLDKPCDPAVLQAAVSETLQSTPPPCRRNQY